MSSQSDENVASFAFRGRQRISQLLPGLLICVILAMAARFVTEHYGGPTMLIALLMGMALNFISEDARCLAGIHFTSSHILRIGVALLGLRITHEQVLAFGYKPILTVVSAVVITIIFGAVFSRVLGLRRDFGVLSGSAVAICGASAALAVASVLPRHKESDSETLLVVVIVTSLSTIAMIIYPMITVLLGLTELESAIFLGGSIHDVAQVVGAGYTVSEGVGDVSTLVKLLRVSMLVPVTLVLLVIYYQKNKEGERGKGGVAIPWFLVAFIILVCLNSLGAVAPAIKSDLIDVSTGCLLAAVAGLGLKSSLKELASAGLKPVFLLVSESLFILLVILGQIYWLL